MSGCDGSVDGSCVGCCEEGCVVCVVCCVLLGITVKVQLALLPFSVAVMVTVPTLFAVTRPDALTVANVGFEEAHVGVPVEPLTTLR